MEAVDAQGFGGIRGNVLLSECVNVNSRDAHIVQKIAEDTLGVYYAQLKEFYASILRSTEYQYVVLVARRSISLAELFFNILWNENPDSQARRKLSEAWQRVTTDSTILSYAKRIAYEIENGYQPKILVVDDVVVQGNGLNELLKSIEYSVLKELYDGSDRDVKVEKWHQIVDSIHIRVFAQNAQLSMVGAQYQLKLKPQYRMEPKQWHDLSRRISNMISATGMANATFIMGANVSSASGENYVKIQQLVTNKDKLQVSKNDVLQCISCELGTLFERHYLGWNGVISGVTKFYCSVRIIRNRYTDSYKLMPFVFLPQLTEMSYDWLKRQIFEKWGLSQNNELLNPGREKSRLEYEAMILFLSESLLSCWTKAAGVKLRGEDFDCMKVFLNYTLNRESSMMDRAEFMRLTDENYLFSWEDLVDVLEKATQDAPALGEHTETVDVNLEYQLENFAYDLKIQELTGDYLTYSKLPSLERQILAVEENRRNNWNIRIEKFIEAFCGKRIKINLHKFFSSLLSFMDDGIVTLKIRREDTGFTQVLRMGEQSQFILPERYQIYQPCMSYITKRDLYHKCDGVKLRNFLKYAQETGELSSEKNVDTLTGELMDYLAGLQQSGQKIEDWDIDFSRPAVLDREDQKWVKELAPIYFDTVIYNISRTSEKGRLFNACLEFYPV